VAARSTNISRPLVARLDGHGAAFAIGFSLSQVAEVDHFVARKEELGARGARGSAV
jgi:hypothetical protein